MKSFRVFMLAAVMCVPQFGLAYEVTGATVVPVTENTAIYMIKYQLGFEQYDAKAPIGIMRTTEKTPYLRYQFMNDGEVISEEMIGRVSGLVLSNAGVQEGQYTIPKGEDREFLLFVLRTADEPLSSDDYLQVTSLPFGLSLAGEKLPNGQLSKRQLAESRTP